MGRSGGGGDGEGGGGDGTKGGGGGKGRGGDGEGGGGDGDGGARKELQVVGVKVKVIQAAVMVEPVAVKGLRVEAAIWVVVEV